MRHDSERGSEGLSGSAMWKAVASRDPAADGAFVYGVTSTGIYCRPSCPSRRPRPDRVRYFASPDEAEEAGFRACKRCAPRSSARSEGEAAAALAAAYIESHARERLTLADLAAQAGVSAGHLQRTFRRVYGRSPRQYQNEVRATALKQRLREGASVSDAAYEVGYGSSRGLYHNATKELGMSPATYRSGGRGATIRYTVAESALGAALIGLTERGVCCVLLGDSEDAVVSELADEFPHAERVRDDEAAGAWRREVVEMLGGGGLDPSVPLDLQGTEFQRRVWAALRKLSPGETVSYSELARRVGMPQAARAVASACAGNHIAVAVPCHRVVRNDGGLGGYKWGVERKRALLEREGARSAGGAGSGKSAAVRR